MPAAFIIVAALAAGLAGAGVLAQLWPPPPPPPRPEFWAEAMRELDVLDGTSLPELPCMHQRVDNEPVMYAGFGYRPIKVYARRCADCGVRLP